MILSVKEGKEKRKKCRTGRQKFAVLFVCLLIGGGICGDRTEMVYAEPEGTDITDLTGQRDETQEQLDAVNETIEELAAEEENVEMQIAEVSEALVQIMAQVELLRQEIDEKELSIAVHQSLYEIAVKREEDQLEAMNVRIRYIYECGDVDYITILVHATSFSDMLTKAEYIESLYEYDRRMLAEYQKTVQEVAEAKAQLEFEKEELEGMLADYEEEQVYMEGVIDELKAISDDYHRQISIAESQAAAYAEQIRRQTEEIRRIEEEARRAAEEEARRVAEEAARKAAEEEAARIAAQQAAADAARTEEMQRQAEAQSLAEEAAQQEAIAAVQASLEQAQQTGVITTTKSASYDVSSIYAANGSDLGKSIAVFACQFIGNPYVAGGTSLTNGADCSGFIFSVYQNFGYKVPRTSYDFRTFGTEVSYENAQPGDVICYPGHVALYIGNGMIVHASSVRTGIKISNANYREFLTVRRII